MDVNCLKMTHSLFGRWKKKTVVCLLLSKCRYYDIFSMLIILTLVFFKFLERYMHFDGNNKPPRTKGVLYQPLGNMDSSYCVKVRYKMCHDTVLSIHTSFVYGNYVITGNALWSRRYRLGDCSAWQQLSVPMSYKHYPHRVTIQGVVNSQSASISIDDFTIILGDCLWKKL